MDKMNATMLASMDNYRNTKHLPELMTICSKLNGLIGFNATVQDSLVHFRLFPPRVVTIDHKNLCDEINTFTNESIDIFVTFYSSI